MVKISFNDKQCVSKLEQIFKIPYKFETTNIKMSGVQMSDVLSNMSLTEKPVILFCRHF